MTVRSMSRIRTSLRAIAELTRRVIGAPDYERYAAHMRQRHPGERLLTREEFARVRLEEKYSKPGGRCC
ncbi:MAG TPA: YbdD/YjiX family protein [Gemmatimonadaceae bacterium]|nr:YbdD/YjiX family protein [Gemmatimonadaceae bacterium]